MLNILDRFEKLVTQVLVILMMIVVVCSTAVLAWMILQDLISPPVFLLDASEMLDLFGLFLLVLVGIELLDTIKAYLIDHIIHEEVIVAAALVAVLRKVIILDIKNTDSFTIVGLALLIAAVVIAYWAIKRTNVKPQGPVSKD